MKIYNTLTRKKEEFVPIDKNEIKIYVCGPTVYNYFHIGNARPFVVFDTLRRYLEYRGEKVNFVQNFTDVDDKIINKAKEEGITAFEVSEKYILEYFKDAEALNVKKASAHPKVTENIPEIIAFVEKLIKKGFAYEIEGDVYYKSKEFNDYGKLSKQNLEDLELGARVEIGEKKENPMDFALWKNQKVDGEIAWDSPWGKGRPGWHIECSAMSQKYLGDTIDIHAGGQDLTFPHHENEIAQSEAATGKKFANYWMHNGFINIDNQKMSKSLNNFFTVREILEKYDGEVMRFFLLSVHYRNPINFSEEIMEQSKSGLFRIKNTRENLIYLIKNTKDGVSDLESVVLTSFNKYKEKFINSLDDDLNTADAISAIFELVTEINSNTKVASKEFCEKSLSLLDELAGVLGILHKKDDTDANEVDEEIQNLVDKRQEARKSKNFALADEIRDVLKTKGYIIEDTPKGVKLNKI